MAYICKINQGNALYEKSREISNYPKMIISVFKDSSIERQFGVIEQYQMDVKVCKLAYSRLHSVWVKGVEIEGKLPGD